METKECYVDLHPVAKDRVMARTKASLAYLAHAIEAARLTLRSTSVGRVIWTRKVVRTARL